MTPMCSPETKIKELEAEIVRLKGLKEPMGDQSPEQQARAWSAIYKELMNVGMDSFFHLGNGIERAVSFIRMLAAERHNLKDELIRLKTTGDSLYIQAANNALKHRLDLLDDAKRRGIHDETEHNKIRKAIIKEEEKIWNIKFQ